MATSTTNYNLRKPASSDNVNVETDISNNMDIIDGAMKSISDTASAKANASDLINLTTRVSALEALLDGDY